MGHCLNAIVGKDQLIDAFSDSWVKAEKIELSQGYSLVKITEDLLDDINELVNIKDNYPFDFLYNLSASLNELLIDLSFSGPLTYIETDYFGGMGHQSSILYKKGKIASGPYITRDNWNTNESIMEQSPKGVRAINRALSELGVICKGSADEFESLNLHWHRD